MFLNNRNSNDMRHSILTRIKTLLNRLISPRRPRQAYWLLMLTIVLFGIVRVVPRLDRSLNIDEPFTANFVALPTSQMLEAFKHDSATPLYFYGLKAWTSLWGESEVALRSFSVIFFAAAIVAVGGAASCVAGRRGGLIAALLFSASSPLGLVYATTARPYALLYFSIALALLTYFSLLRLPRPQRVAGQSVHARQITLYVVLMALNVAGLLTHISYIFLLLGLVLAASVAGWRSFILMGLNALLSLLIFWLLWGPIYSQAFGLPATNWMGPPSLNNLIEAVVYLWGRPITVLISGYVLLILFLRRHALKPVLTEPIMGVGALVVVCTLLVPFAVAQFRPIFYANRIDVLFLPMACIVTSVLLVRLARPDWTIPVLAAVAIIAIGSTVQTIYEPDPYPVRQSLQAIAPQLRCSDQLIVSGITLSEVRYYARRLRLPNCIVIQAYPSEQEVHPGWMDVPTLLQDKERLQQEATALAQQAAASSSGRVWLFDNTTRYGLEVASVVKSALNHWLQLEQTLNLGGSYFDSVLVYTPH